MKVGKYKIWWKYNYLTGITICAIQSLDDVHTDGWGRVCKHPNDVHDKDKARKKSLLRAMKNYGLTKPERAEIWEAYRTMTKKERW